MKNKIDYDELQDLLKTHQHIEIRGTILIKFEQTPYLRVIIRELNGNDYWMVDTPDILCLLTQFQDHVLIIVVMVDIVFSLLIEGIINE